MLSTASVAKSEQKQYSDDIKSETIPNITTNNHTNLVGGNQIPHNTVLNSEPKRIEPPIVNQPPINNIINVSNTNDKDTIILEYNYNDKRFLFHDKNKSFLGSFTGNEFIKYVVSSMVSSFMPETNCSSAQDILEKYICTIDISKPTISISIKNHLESPFTGHVEMLIKLYKQIEDFEKNNLKEELSLLSSADSIIAEKTFMNLVYCLLNHTLKIIAILSDIIKNDSNSEMKDKLLRYSVAIMYKISSVTRSEIDKRIENIDGLINEKMRLESVKDTLGERVLSLEQNILNQDEKITQILSLMENSHQSGGANSDTISGIDSNTTSSVASTSVNSDNKYVSSSSDVENIMGDDSVSTSLSDMLNTESSVTNKNKKDKKKSKKHVYSSTSSFRSSNGFKESLSDSEDNDLDYLTSNESTTLNKVINI